ncbi:cysteine proteinase [Hypoxylon sp. FL1150]|nr:cysteine proteinase [Hypoxylon sp. FL1150]
MEAKAKEEEALVSKTNGKEALQHAIAAADMYMKAAGATSEPREKSRLVKKCQAMLTRAENLKKTAQNGGGVAAAEKRLKLPRRTREIPIGEQNILLRGSKLHGNIFPPWDADPDPKEFAGDPFTDPSIFSLSERQRDVFSGWKRPRDIVGADGGEDSLMEAQHDFDLVQDITTDCSLVASLCASMHHLRPGPKSLLPTLMFPVDFATGQPRLSASGRYVFRLFFNGCFRRVVIDDRLPSSANDRTLYVVDRQNPRLLWPALVEKAYLKVRGGYDFPGSNSGTDLCVLTGWIPQQLFLRNDDMDWDRTWKRIKNAYDYGDVVVTLGTGRLSLDEEETLGLVGEHDYAVLNMVETATGNRKMLVKNPWCDGMVWRGVGSSDVSSEASDDHPTKLIPGSFWISLDDITQNFESLYLNWNPGLFTDRQDHHFSWQLPDANMTHSFAHNPQYSFSIAADGGNTSTSSTSTSSTSSSSVWILLSRHFQDGELELLRRNRGSSPDDAAATTSLAEVSSKLGFMSIYVFADVGGRRVQLDSRPAYRGDFVDSPQTLAPFEARPGVKYTAVVATQDMPLPRYSFTLSFFSRGALSISPAAPARSHYAEVRGSWTRRTAGGNAASPTYLQNPQFAVAVPRAGPLSLLLSTARDDLPVHVALVWAGGRRVASVGNRDLVVTSGDYRRSCALAEHASVAAGTYTVVCSTFEPGHLADFTLRVGSDVPCAITPVPPAAAGQMCTRLPRLVFGNDQPTDRSKKKRAAVSAARLTRASVVVVTASSESGGNGNNGYPYLPTTFSPPTSSTTHTPVGSGASTPRPHPTVRVSVECGMGPDRKVLAVTNGGGFREVGANGLRTAAFDIDPHGQQRERGLWLVVEQLGLTADGSSSSGDGNGLQVEMLSEGPVQVGGWEVVDD